MHVLKSTTAAAAVMLAAISLGACSSSGSGSGPAKDHTPLDRSHWPAETPASGLVKGLELPLEAYMSSYADQVTVDTALRTLQTRCMAEYGLTVDLPRPGVNPPPYSNAMSIEARYGVTDRTRAEKYGYGLPKELTRSTEPVDKGLSGVEVEVLTGRTKPEFLPPEGAEGDGPYFTGADSEPARARYQGKKLHEGGCAGWSKRQLKLNESDAGHVSQLASTSLSESRSRKPVKKAIKDWSACMKKRGRSAADPYRAMEQGYANGDGTTEDAIELALDDIDCKEQTRLIEVWFKAESAVQKRLIEENKDQLTAVKTRMSKVLAAAKAVK
ncbi:hypothetical protein [Streptomyces sp. bgisy027]|uniref:hypothetical protein n=1 Tax=Streptomyces sp. bgisy027 TaxID=3413770 RepID=UPI003D7576BA